MEDKHVICEELPRPFCSVYALCHIPLHPMGQLRPKQRAPKFQAPDSTSFTVSAP